MPAICGVQEWICPECGRSVGMINVGIVEQPRCAACRDRLSLTDKGLAASSPRGNAHNE